MNPSLIAVCVVGAIGLLGGALLVIGSKVFAVTKDERAEEVELARPGANCGACGYAGCSAYAKAVAEGAPVNQCLAGGAAVAEMQSFTPTYSKRFLALVPPLQRT